MPVIADPDRWTFRWGPNANNFGDVYERTCQGQREHDDRFYLYAVTSEIDPSVDVDGKIRRSRALEMIEVVKKARELGKIYGWKKIIWLRKRKDGTDHVAEFNV